MEAITAEQTRDIAAILLAGDIRRGQAADLGGIAAEAVAGTVAEAAGAAVAHMAVEAEVADILGKLCAAT